MTEEIQEFISYLRDNRKSSANTEISYRRDLRKAAEYFERQDITRVEQITQTNIRSYLLFMEKQKFATATISRSVASLHAFFQYLVKMKKIEQDPSEDLRPPKVEKKEPEILSVEEIEKLMGQPNMETAKGVRDRAMMELLYATGIRVSELTHLLTEDVNLQLGYIVCRDKDKERAIPFGDAAREVMQRYLGRERMRLVGEKDCPYLFTNCAGKPMSRQGFWKVLKGYVQEAGIQMDITPHTLRHSFAAHLIQNGADVRAVQEMMGHKEKATTMEYVDIASRRLGEIYRRAQPRG